MTQQPHLRSAVIRETLGIALDTFRSFKVRFTLTALGVTMGIASVILVVTIGLTGKEYILDQIQGIGTNMIYVIYDPGGGNAPVTQDLLTLDDLRAVQQQVHGVVAASPLVLLPERIPIGGGKEQDVRVLGVDPEYRQIRNLEVPAGRFVDPLDAQAHAKVAVLAERLAQRVFGSQEAALNKTLRIGALPFTVIGTFRERVETFGQSELTDHTLIIPFPVIHYFISGTPGIAIFLSMADFSQVAPATERIKAILHSRHRPDSVYRVENLTQLLSAATKIANAVTVVLLLVALVTLVVAGVGIMNIMLATVNARRREIGIRRAVGATAAEIRLQFLAEAVLISLIGGVCGIALGLALPLSLRFFTSYQIPISGLSVIIAIVTSSLVGIVFGTAPAARAAHLDPIQSLHE